MERAGHHEFLSLANLDKDQIMLVKWNVSAPTGKQPRSVHTPWLLQQKNTRYHRILTGMGDERWARGKTSPVPPTYMLKCRLLATKEDAPKDKDQTGHHRQLSWKTTEIAWSKSRQYKLKWLKDTKAFKCFGCKSAIRITGEIPEPPNNVIASTNEYCSFMKDRKLQVYFGPTHYHLLFQCFVAKILIHRPILPSQTLTEGCFKMHTSATFKMNFRFEETLTLISSPQWPL